MSLLPSLRRHALAATTLAAALSLAGCAAASTTTTTGGVIGVVHNTPTTEAPRAEVPASRDDLVAERRASPLAVTADDNDASIVHVRYLGGDPACTGARVAVDESAAVVRVVLFVGDLPGAGAACDEVPAVRELPVRLARPLGTREVLFR